MVQKSNSDLLSGIKKQIGGLEKEVLAVYNALVLPHWGKDMHGFPQTLYGYMMCVFSFVDLLSAHWKGDKRGQSERMLCFMNTYMRSQKEENRVAIKTWRHSLMHTARPRALLHAQTARKHKWLLHWYKHLPEEQHYTFNDDTDVRILSIGLVYLIRDLKKAVDNYDKELLTSIKLQAKFSRFQTKLSSYKL